MSLQRSSFIIAPDAAETVGAEDIVEARILDVLDGDGFIASVWNPLRGSWQGRIPFRFAFIDAPEREQPFADEAKAFLSALILGKSLGLILIGKQSTGYMPFDRYGRLLCMGYFTGTMQIGRVYYLLNGKCGTGVVRTARSVMRNIELEMVINGWAWVLDRYAFDRVDEYMAAQEDARRNKRGLWAMDNPEPPWHFKYKQRHRRAGPERQANLL